MVDATKFVGYELTPTLLTIKLSPCEMCEGLTKERDEARTKLAESEEKNRLLLDQSSSLSWNLDVALREQDQARRERDATLVSLAELYRLEKARDGLRGSLGRRLSRTSILYLWAPPKLCFHFVCAARYRDLGGVSYAIYVRGVRCCRSLGL